ncbi:MAG: type III secretion system chaperone [Opitutaceae bacterium]|jgi:hypothetical protein|nr:type III secretion system chaperone [Opitutaceae bacterium]
MNELKNAVRALCDELGLEPPAPDGRGRYELQVDELVLRIGPWSTDEAVLEGVIRRFGRDAAKSWENQQDVLRQVLTWNIARLKGQARPEVLSFDDEENILLLWRTWPLNERLSFEMIKGAEDMLNELEFWRGKLQAAAPSGGGNGGRS